MRDGVPIRFAAFGEQFVCATVDELLAGAGRLGSDARFMWGQRAAGNGNAGELAASVRHRRSS